MIYILKESRENEFLRTSNSKETEDFNNTFIKSSQESQKQILKAQQQIIKGFFK